MWSGPGGRNTEPPGQPARPDRGGAVEPAEATPNNQDAKTDGRTVLGIEGSRFTINGRPTFLLGISYYGGLGASDDSVRRDLDDLQRDGFHWLRVWATWSAFDRDVSAVNADGEPREPFLSKLQSLVAECDRRGLVVDVTLTRGDGKEGGAIRNLKCIERPSRR